MFDVRCYFFPHANICCAGMVMYFPCVEIKSVLMRVELVASEVHLDSFDLCAILFTAVSIFLLAK